MSGHVLRLLAFWWDHEELFRAVNFKFPNSIPSKLTKNFEKGGKHMLHGEIYSLKVLTYF